MSKWLNRCLCLNSVQKTVITSQGSLTRILKESYESFSVHIVSERRILKKHSVFWERQVILYGEQKPLVFAVSILPIEAFKNQHWQKLKTIKNQPLGDLLFQIKPFQRTRFKFFKIKGHWARESCFHNQLSVTEIFLIQ